MDESWIKKYLTSPLQSTSFSSNVRTSSDITQFDKINLQNFTPLLNPLSSPAKNQQIGRTPLSRWDRKRLFSSLKNSSETHCSVGKIQSPKTPRHALKILKKVAYENSASSYLVQWNCGSAEENNPSTTWEWGDRLSPNCRKLVADFEESIAKDPKKACEFTDYEVEAILDRTVRGELRYLVKWVGWRVPTWEEVGNLLPDYSKLVKEFERINMKDIQFWTVSEDTRTGEVGNDSEGSKEPLSDNDQMPSRLPFNHKFPISLSATAARVVKATKVLNKLDRNKENASYLMLWPDEAGVRSDETPNKSWEKRISLGTVEAILKFEDALQKRRVWARKAIMYEVEKVLGRRKTLGPNAPQYLVKWKGYDEISWESMESLQISFKHLLVAYALGRPRTMEKGKQEASEIRRKNVPEEMKAEFKKSFNFLKIMLTE